MLCLVLWQIGIDVSEERNVSIFRIKLSRKRRISFSVLGMKRLHIGIKCYWI